MNLIKKIFVAACLFAGITSVEAQTSGALDTNFNPIDHGFKAGDGPNTFLRGTAVQPDGKVIIFGDFTGYNNTTVNRIARLDTNGLIDATFNSGTGFSGEPHVAKVLANGKIIVAGDFSSYNGNSRNRLVRLNSDGTLDASLVVGTGANASITSLAVQSNGKLLIGGYFSMYNGTSALRVARINTDGSLDTSFNIGTGPNNYVHSICIQNDGKIIVAGKFTTFNGSAKSGIVRLLPNGAVDNTFNIGTGFNVTSSFNNGVYTAAVLPNGKIVVGGEFTSFNGTMVSRVVLLTSTGSLDLATQNMGTNGIVYCLLVQPGDGKIIATGNFTSYAGSNSTYLTRFFADGLIDTTFQPEIVTYPSGIITSASLDSSGRLLVEGYFRYPIDLNAYYFARLLPTGTIDYSFNPKTGANEAVETIAIQADKKILIGGKFTNYNGIPQNHLCRLNQDGTIDTSFKSVSGFNGFVHVLKIQPDGKILVGGDFTSYNDTAYNRLVRLNSDGSIDGSFNIGSGANHEILTISIQPDGKIIIGGWFDTFNSAPRGKIARLNANGSLDNTFYTGSGFTNAVFTSAIQADGKIILGGSFDRYQGLTENRLIRLSTNGSKDPSFALGSGPSSTVTSLVIDAAGKIVIGGSFYSYNGVSRGRLARINPNGSLDQTFSNSFTPNLYVHSVLVQPDNKVVVGGQFTQLGFSQSRSCIARFYANGNPDVSFNSGVGTNSSVGTMVNALALQDSLLLIGGSFISYNNQGKNRLARIIGCESSSSTDNITACNAYTWIDSITYTSNNNTSTFLTKSKMGCDSLVTLNLTIDTVSASISYLNDTLFANPSGPFNYFFLDCDNNYSIVQGTYDPYYVPPINGNYAVYIQKSGCSDTSNCTSVTGIGIIENQNIKSASIYPNPSSGVVHIELKKEKPYIVRVTDAKGSLVTRLQGATNTISLNLSLQPGVYYLQIEFSDGILEVHKLVVL